MTISTDNKRALTCLVVGLGLAWVIDYMMRREKKESSVADNQPIITEESITVAVNAYRSGQDAGETRENLEEINRQLKDEFGLTVEYKPMSGKYYVNDLSGKRVKEV